MIKNVHISTIKAGDTVLHCGDLKTVSNNNVKSCLFMGLSLFGDSYNLGYKPVKLVTDVVEFLKAGEVVS